MNICIEFLSTFLLYIELNSEQIRIIIISNSNDRCLFGFMVVKDYNSVFIRFDILFFRFCKDFYKKEKL